jgi:hypothetical protein
MFFGNVSSSYTYLCLGQGSNKERKVMPAVFLTSDTHFVHAGVCHFTRNDGVTKLRPWTDPDEMDEEMVKR